VLGFELNNSKKLKICIGGKERKDKSEHKPFGELGHHGRWFISC